jgi:hypothetical protein
MVRKLTTIIKKEMEIFRRLHSGEKVEFVVTRICLGGEVMKKAPWIQHSFGAMPSFIPKLQSSGRTNGWAGT